MATTRAKAKNQALEASTDLINQISKSVAKVTREATEGKKTVRDMIGKAEKVDIVIEKLDKKDRKWKHFLAMPGQAPEDIVATRPQEFCKDQGGGGSYKIDYYYSDGTELNQKDIEVAGEGWMESRHDREARGVMGPMGATGVNGIPALFGQGQTTAAGGQELMRQVREGYTTAISTQQRSSDQMMQMLMASLMGSQNQQKQGPSDSDRQMQEEMRRMRDELTETRRIAEAEKAASAQRDLQKQIADLQMSQQQGKQDQMFEFLKMSQLNKDSGSSDLFKMMMMNMEGSKASKEETIGLFKEMLAKPDGNAKLTEMMMANTVGVMNMMQQAASSNLLGGGGAHPGWDVLSNALEGIAGAAAAHFETKGAQLAENPAQVTAPVPDVPELDEAPTLAGLPEHQEEEPVDEGPDLSGFTLDDFLGNLEKSDHLDAITLEKIGEQSALATAIKRLKQGVDIKEITARIYSHANHGNKIAIRWMERPEIWTPQILLSHGGKERTVELVQDIARFWWTKEQEGDDFDPNQWAISTGYKPIKVPGDIKSTSTVNKAKVGKKPSFGVSSSVPKDAVPFDASVPPENYVASEEEDVTPDVDDPAVEEPNDKNNSEEEFNEHADLEEGMG